MQPMHHHVTTKTRSGNEGHVARCGTGDRPKYHELPSLQCRSLSSILYDELTCASAGHCQMRAPRIVIYGAWSTGWIADKLRPRCHATGVRTCETRDRWAVQPLQNISRRDACELPVDDVRAGYLELSGLIFVHHWRTNCCHRRL
jgi:hypothetical protein